jgi:hypothetical protein
MVAVGGVLSIQFTVAVVSHVFQAKSSNSKVKFPLFVNVYILDHPLFVIVTQLLLNDEIVAITLPEVFCHDVGL